MKIAKIIAAAGLSIAAIAGASSASAQDWRHQRGDHGRYEHRYDRGRHMGWDRGRHYGSNRHHRHCWTTWRHHRRMTICR